MCLVCWWGVLVGVCLACVGRGWVCVCVLCMLVRVCGVCWWVCVWGVLMRGCVVCVWYMLMGVCLVHVAEGCVSGVCWWGVLVGVCVCVWRVLVGVYVCLVCVVGVCLVCVGGGVCGVCCVLVGSVGGVVSGMCWWGRPGLCVGLGAADSGSVCLWVCDGHALGAEVRFTLGPSPAVPRPWGDVEGLAGGRLWLGPGQEALGAW